MLFNATRARAFIASALGAGAVVLSLASGCHPQGVDADPAEHHYGDKEAALARFEEPERDAWAMPAEVVEALEITPRMDIADIGAGSGYFTRRLATAADEGTTYAVDVDADFKGHIETHRAEWHTPNIVTRLAVYENPLLPRETVDLVFISNTYSFLQDRATYFTAVYKALRHGGRLAVIDWRDDVECPRQLGCGKRSDRVPVETAITELQAVGFEVIARHEFLPYQYFVVLGRGVDVAEPPRPTDPTPASPAASPAPGDSDPADGAEPETTGAEPETTESAQARAESDGSAPGRL